MKQAMAGQGLKHKILLLSCRWGVSQPLRVRTDSATRLETNNGGRMAQKRVMFAIRAESPARSETSNGGTRHHDQDRLFEHCWEVGPTPRLMTDSPARLERSNGGIRHRAQYVFEQSLGVSPPLPVRADRPARNLTSDGGTRRQNLIVYCFCGCCWGVRRHANWGGVASTT